MRRGLLLLQPRQQCLEQLRALLLVVASVTGRPNAYGQRSASMLPAWPAKRRCFRRLLTGYPDGRDSFEPPALPLRISERSRRQES
jgi:hypothetical protein